MEMEVRAMSRAFSRTTHTKPTVQAMRREGAEGKGRAELESLQGPQAQGRATTGTRAEGIAACLAPAIATREGCRVLVYGRTRWGKSSFARHLVRAALDSGVASTALIHDVKYPDRVQYLGATVTGITEIGQHLRSGADTLILRPPFPACEAAHAAVVLSESGEPTLLLVDETRRALGGSQIWCDGKNADGTTTEWGTETVGPNVIRRLGLSDRRLTRY